MRSRGGNTTVTTRVDMDPNAVEELEAIATPYLMDCAEIIGRSIVAMVPVHDGVAVKTYKPKAIEQEAGEVRLHPNSPFWHWLEYGTATSPVYRPIARGVQATGARWEPS